MLLLRLRQLGSSILMCEQTLLFLLQSQDLDHQWQLGQESEGPSVDDDLSETLQVLEMVLSNVQPGHSSQRNHVGRHSQVPSDEGVSSAESDSQIPAPETALTSGFRKLLRSFRKSGRGKEINDRSV
jgi:hypothetical protein